MKDCFTVEVGEMNEGDLVYNSVAQQQNRGLCIKKLGRFPFILNQGYIDHLSSRLCCFLGRCLGWRFSRSSLSGLSFSRHYGPYWEICCVTLCVLQTSKGFWVFLSRNWTITIKATNLETQNNQMDRDPPTWTFELVQVNMCFLRSPLSWLMEQKNPKFLWSLQNAQRDTTNFAIRSIRCDDGDGSEKVA